MRLQWRSYRWIFIACLLIYGTSLVPVAKDTIRLGASPFILVARHMGEKFISSLQLIQHIPELAHENGQLRAKVNELTSLQVMNNELKHENELLRKELNVSTSPDGSNLIAAQVISRSASVSQQVIVINKGKEDGFQIGMPVVAQGYLVGRVAEVLPHTSSITLLTSVDSLLPVVLQNSRSVGLLKGGAGGLVIDEIPRDVAIAPDEAIVTSNIGDVVKSGLPVGAVKAVLSGKSDVFQSARVISPIDLSRLEVVFGVK